MGSLLALGRVGRMSHLSPPFTGIPRPPSDFKGDRGYCSVIPAVPPRAVLHPGVPGLARREPQGMGGIKGMEGLFPSALLHLSMQLKAEHLQGETASAADSFSQQLRSWPAADRGACSCLYTCPCTCWSTSETEGGPS